MPPLDVRTTPRVGHGAGGTQRDEIGERWGRMRGENLYVLGGVVATARAGVVFLSLAICISKRKDGKKKRLRRSREDAPPHKT